MLAISNKNKTRIKTRKFILVITKTITLRLYLFDNVECNIIIKSTLFQLLNQTINNN